MSSAMDHLDTLTKAFASTTISEAPSSDDIPKIDRLSSLPAEIRNQIFELVLKEDSTIEIRDYEDTCWRDRCPCTIEHEEVSLYARERKPRYLALSETCKQFHSDCSQRFYALNSFLICIDHAHQVEPIVRGLFTAIGPSNAAAFKRMMIQLCLVLDCASELEDCLSTLLDPILGIEPRLEKHRHDLTPFLGHGRSISLELWCEFREGDSFERPMSNERGDPWYLQLTLSGVVELWISLMEARWELERWQASERKIRPGWMHRFLDEGVARVLSAFKAWEEIGDTGEISEETARRFRWRYPEMRMQEGVWPIFSSP